MDPGVGEAIEQIPSLCAHTVISVDGLTALRLIRGSLDWLFA